MKGCLKVFGFVLLAFSLNACDWFEDAAKKDVNFESDLAVDLNVLQEESKAVEEQVVLDPLSDEEIEEYKNDIKNIQITSLGYTVTGINSVPEGLTFSGKIEYSEGAGSKKVLATFTDLDINALATSGAEQTLNIPSSEIDNIVTIFKANNPVTLHISGELSEVPADFDMEIVAHLKVTAEVEI